MLEKFINDLFNYISDMIIITDVNKKILSINSITDKKLEWKLSEIKGKAFDECYRIKDTNDNDISIDYSILNKDNNILYIEDVYISGKTYFRYPVNIKIMTHYEGENLKGYIYIINDITEKKRGDEIFERSFKIIGRAKRELESMIDTLPYGLIALNGEFNILRANKMCLNNNIVDIYTTRDKSILTEINLNESEKLKLKEYLYKNKDSNEKKSIDIKIDNTNYKFTLLRGINNKYNEDEMVEYKYLLLIEKII